MASVNKIDRAQQMYREGRYEEALGFFTEALTMAKTNPQRISLHSNRAACYLKLQHFNKAAEECTSVLELDQNHTGALMLRAQTLVTLKEYRSSLFDVNRLIELNPSSEVYHNLEARLRTQLSLAPIPESEVEWEEEEEEEEEEDEDEQEREHEETEQFSNEGSEIKEVVHHESGVKKVHSFEIPTKKVISPEQEKDRNPTLEQESEKDPKGWKSIPKPKGHATLDYARWDRVEDDSESDSDSDSDSDSQPQYRFRLKTVGVRPVK